MSEATMPGAQREVVSSKEQVVPNAAGVIGMWAFARHSERQRERPLHVAIACVLGAIGLAGAASAAGIALINAIGNLAGFVSPSVVGWIKEATGSIDNGLYLVSACLIASALALTFLRRRFASATIIPNGELV
jgi:nitrate/nitrite transporter NarK